MRDFLGEPIAQPSGLSVWKSTSPTYNDSAKRRSGADAALPKCSKP